MDEQFPSSFAPAGEPPSTSPAEQTEELLRRNFRRRLAILAAAAGTAFALTTWLLVRWQNSRERSSDFSNAADVVRTHLEAVSRGELRAAYSLFSPRYREQVSFEAYHQLILTHRRMFRLKDVRISRDEETTAQAMLETRMVSENGERFIARFTLVRDDGRWWIDDLRWGTDSSRGASSV